MTYSKKVYFKDKVFVVDKEVYEPAEDTFLGADQIKASENDIVLDVGTGCGIFAVLAARNAERVVAVDVNPYAIECAKRNAENNGVKDMIDFRLGNLFESIKPNESFSLILFNSPYLPSKPEEEKSWIGKSWAGGKNGRAVIDRFIIDAPHFLEKSGRILLVQSSLSNVNRTLEMFSERNLHAKVVAQVKVAFETIVVVEAKRRLVGDLEVVFSC